MIIFEGAHHLLNPRWHHFSNFMRRFQDKCMLKVLLTQIYLAIRKPLSNVLIIGDWGPVVNDTIVKNKFIQIFFNYLKTKQINDELTLALLFSKFSNSSKWNQKVMGTPSFGEALSFLPRTSTISLPYYLGFNGVKCNLT